MSEKEWVSVDIKNPSENGWYLVTVMGTALKREVKRSAFTDGKWNNPRVIAWRTLESIEPYTGDTVAAQKKKELVEHRAKVREREELSFNLRLSGKTFREIAKITGRGLDVSARTDVDNYLKRNGYRKCDRCKNSYAYKQFYKGCTYKSLKCEKLNMSVHYGGCPLFEEEE